MLFWHSISPSVQQQKLLFSLLIIIFILFIEPPANVKLWAEIIEKQPSCVPGTFDLAQQLLLTKNCQENKEQQKHFSALGCF